VWQALHAELRDRGFTVFAVAMDSRESDALRWIEAARPEYVTAIDRDHRVADLYHMVNVPQAVWIDEEGRIVRPPEPAGAYEGFRRMDRATRTMPEDAARANARAKALYVDAVRDWVLRGAASEHALDAERARARLATPTGDTAMAHALFRLGQALIRLGEGEEGRRHMREASERHPESWCIWRQQYGVNELGLASGPEFWARVDALGDRRYYPRIDISGMP
jgi:hypothetical protein